MLGKWERGPLQGSGWMAGVKVALGNGGVTVEAATMREDRKEWRALVHM